MSITCTFLPGAKVPAGTPQTFPSFDEFVNAISPVDVRTTKDGPGWCSATFMYRDKKHAKPSLMTLLGLDFDGGKLGGENPGEDVENVARVFDWLTNEHLTAYTHETFSSYELPDGRVKLRVILPLSRAVTYTEFQDLWARVVGVVNPLAKVDKQCREPERFFYLPSCPVGIDPRPGRRFAGEALDVDAWLAKAAMTLVHGGAPGAKAYDLNLVKAHVAWSEKQWLASLRTCVNKEAALNTAAYAVAALRCRASKPVDDVVGLCVGELAKNTVSAPIQSMSKAFETAQDAVEDAVLATTAELERRVAERAAFAAKATEAGLNFVTNLEGAPVWCTENLNKLFRGHPDLKGRLRHNLLRDSHEIAEKVPFADKGEITDKVKTLALEWATETFLTYGAQRGKTFNSADLALSAIIAACDPYDPIQDYFSSLPAWDGTPRLSGWLVNYAKAEDTPYVREIGKRWLLQIVARTFVPGCEAPGVLMLVGAQGVGKSSIPVRLLGHIDGAVTDNLPAFGDKDIHIALAGCAIAELSELFTFKKSDNEAVKAVITALTPQARRSYDKCKRTWLRRGVFVGTTNDARFLTDDTGNRRAWSVRVGVVDLGGLSADRDQIWAEAMHVWNTEGLGCQKMPASMWAIQEAAQAEFVIEDDAEEIFRDVIASRDKERFAPRGGSSCQLADEQIGPDGLLWLTVPQTYTLCGLNPLSNVDQRKLVKWVKSCKWEKGLKRLNGRATKIFRKIEE